MQDLVRLSKNAIKGKSETKLQVALLRNQLRANESGKAGIMKGIKVDRKICILSYFKLIAVEILLADK